MVTVLGNLIDNAMDACDRDDPWIEVTVTQDDHELLIRVADSGPGMDSDDLRKGHAAWLFHEIRRPGRARAGTGPGRPGDPQRHGGTLRADVTYGSVVTATVPRPASACSTISVLIVEDDPLIAEAHQAYLGRLEGFSVAAVAHTARDAMRAAAAAAASGASGRPGAAGHRIARCQRNLSGVRRFSGLRPAPDIIAITSERDLEMVRAAVAHGALAYLLSNT